MGKPIALMMTTKDTYGLVFDAIYNMIPITKYCDLGQSILAYVPFLYIPIGFSTLVIVDNSLQ